MFSLSRADNPINGRVILYNEPLNLDAGVAPIVGPPDSLFARSTRINMKIMKPWFTFLFMEMTVKTQRSRFHCFL